MTNGLTKDKAYTSLSGIMEINELGKKIYKVNCPICQELFVCLVRKDDFFRHLAEFHGQNTHSLIVQPDWMIERDRQKNKELCEKFKRENTIVNTSPIPRRCFYVDTAKSIKSKEGIRYGKSVLVENGKCLGEFANSKVQGANGAEAYAILCSLYGMIENKVFKTEPLKIHIYSDSMIVVRSLNQPKKGLEYGEKKYPKNNDIDTSHYYKYIGCIRKLVSEHNLYSKIKFVGIKGDKNPADYFSRDAYKGGNPSRQGKFIAAKDLD